MGKIHVMDSRLANMIAAGEVIERPSSVIKELVENSVDAGASHIEVSILGAGRKLISVKDNGSGMDEEDAVLCFTRHASSKILDEYQLFRIKTMGFRGEALPSIASVSKVCVYTSTGEEVGSKVEASAEGITRQDYRAIKGTVFEVRELFYNTPVRLKYLKSDHSEIASCLEVMQRLALSYPNIAFDFYVDEKLSFSTTGRGDLLEVIARLYGNEIAKKMVKIDLETLEYKVSGYIGKPELTRASRYYMITILNNRNVYLPKVQKTIIESYKDYVFSSNYPFVVLHIEAEPSLVDVNVHPSKKEVRLSSEEILLNLLFDGLKAKLESLNPIHEAEIKPIKKEVETVSLFESKSEEPVVYRPRTMVDVPSTLSFNDVVASKKEDIVEEKIDKPLYESETKEIVVEQVKEEVVKQKKNIPDFKVVGQIHKTYIVLEGNDGFYLMDQHAAMERINYEKFQKFYNSNYDIVEPLIPLTIDLSLSDMKKLTKDKFDILKGIGIEAEEFGPTMIRIISYPTFLDEKGKTNEYLESIFHDVISRGTVDINELRRDVIASMACKASLKANDELSLLEMESLYKRLFECDNPSCCPHGRPTIIHFSKYDVEKMFKRSGI